MIIYRHPIGGENPSAPPWLDGAPSVCYAETDTHRLAGIGPDFQMGDRKSGWVDVGDGWQAVRALPDQTIDLYRRLNWAKSRVVSDAEGRQWQVPVILTPMGLPAIISTYGDDWLPVYTPIQARMLLVAEAAKAALDARDVPLSAACQWAAEGLAAANYITVLTIQRCHMMDSHLAQNVLLAMTGVLDAAAMELDGDHG